MLLRHCRNKNADLSTNNLAVIAKIHLRRSPVWEKRQRWSEIVRGFMQGGCTSAEETSPLVTA